MRFDNQPRTESYTFHRQQPYRLLRTEWASPAMPARADVAVFWGVVFICIMVAIANYVAG